MTMQNTTPALIFRNCQGQIFTKYRLTSVPPVTGRIVFGGTGGMGTNLFRVQVEMEINLCRDGEG